MGAESDFGAYSPHTVGHIAQTGFEHEREERKKVQAKLKQATLNFKSLENQNQIFSSNVGFVPSGGPWAITKTGRGCKRGIEDQMEDKKRQNEWICLNELNSDCNF